MNSGIFIVFEGSDGCGKTTQIKLLTEYLKSIGHDVVYLREPGGTPIGEKLRNIVLDVNHLDEMEPDAEALLYAASRVFVVKLIKEYISAGKTVILDRYFYSSIAYQAYGRNLGVRFIENINLGALNLRPDVAFWLNIKPEIAKMRRDKASCGELDRIESEEESFFERVYFGYTECAGRYEEFVPIDASGDIETVAKSIQDELDILCSNGGVLWKRKQAKLSLKIG